MSLQSPRMRIFAGPNGSGKSTIKDMLPSAWLGVYINADDIEKSLREQGVLALDTFEVTASSEELHEFLRNSSLLRTAGLLGQAEQLQLVAGKICLGAVRWFSNLHVLCGHRRPGNQCRTGTASG